MAKGQKRKEDEKDLDFGAGIEETSEEEVDLTEQPQEVVSKQDDVLIDTNMNRIVEDDEEVRFRGRVNLDELPVCPCCSAVWGISEGTLVSPGCGCAIHPHCPKCGKCEAHCKGHRK